MSTPRLAGARHPARRRGSRRVWVLTFAVAAAAVTVTVAVARLHSPPSPVRVPWPIFIPLAILGELAVVHLKFREDAHSFSMSEIPLVLGLFLTAPGGLVVAQLIGNVVSLGVVRRQQPVKLAFNLSQFALQTAIAIVAFHAVLGDGDPIGWRGSVGVVVAVSVSLILANALIATAIRISGGRLRWREVSDTLLLTVLAAWMNAALGLVWVIVVWTRPASAWAAAVPPVVLYLAYKAYAGQRQERQRFQALYEATRVLHRTPQIEGAMVAAASQARTMFGAAEAEVLLYPEGPAESGYRTVLGPGEHREIMGTVPPDDGNEPWSEAMRGGGSHLLDTAGSRRRPLRRAKAMVAPLWVKGRVIGVMAVRWPLGDISFFTPHDLRLLETLAGQVGVSLENGRLEDSLAQLTRLKEELRHQALHDALTGLANRTLLRERLGEAVAEVGEEDHRAAVIFLDLDDFKTVNDAYGHAVGDQILAAVADRLRACFREEDTVARLGGDEFAVLFRDLLADEDAARVAARVVGAFERPFPTAGRSMSLTASVGVAFVRSGVDPDEVIRDADQAMYAAKNQQKGSYRLFEDGSHTEITRRAALRTGLATAIAEEELTLDYQPIVSLDGAEVLGLEALARWRHEELGPVAPDEFIAAAEETGLIIPLGRWVLRQACRSAALWMRSHPGSFGAVAVNLSPRQITEGDLAGDVRRALDESHLSAGNLVLEITENVLMQGTSRVLEEVRSLGVRVAIDDFGSGYSSLGYLDLLPIDILKVDRSFVSRVTGPEESPLLRMVLQIGEALDLVTVAEGIESAAQAEHLRKMGFRYGQGFHFARPLSPSSVGAFLEAARPAARASLAVVRP